MLLDQIVTYLVGYQGFEIINKAECIIKAPHLPKSKHSEGYFMLSDNGGEFNFTKLNVWNYDFQFAGHGKILDQEVIFDRLLAFFEIDLDNNQMIGA